MTGMNDTARAPLPGGTTEEARGADIEARDAAELEAEEGGPDPDPVDGDEGTIGVADDDTVGTDPDDDDRRFGDVAPRPGGLR
jgi:hypothetical protein